MFVTTFCSTGMPVCKLGHCHFVGTAQQCNVAVLETGTKNVGVVTV